MKRKHLYLRRIVGMMVLCFGITLTATGADKTDAPCTSFVDTRIGTGGHGHTFLGANVPFGFVQLGPTQHTHGWDWCSGYHDSDSILVGFSHTHLSGTGVGDLGDITFLPVSTPQQDEVRFSHSNESASVGYYSVKLNDPNVFVELTASKRAGMHRYTFGGNVGRQLLAINLKRGIGWDHRTASSMKQEDSQTVVGYRRSTGWAKDQQVFFVARFSQPVSFPDGINDTISVLEVQGNGQPLLVKVGLSAVSIDNARQNLDAEMPNWDFNGTVLAAQKAWEEELGKIRISTQNDTLKQIFYTALYHTMTAPSIYSDVNGDYRGADGQPHHGDFVNYTTLSLWDTYRAAHPLMTIIHPEKLADMAETFIHIWKEQGVLPVWHLMNNETYCMVGNPAIPVLADMLLKGYVKDGKTALEAMKSSALLDNRSLGLLKQYNYIPYDKEPAEETVAKALEYALADACIALVAKKQGDKQGEKYFYDRSMTYKKYFDPKTRFMRAVGSDGKFREPFDPFATGHQGHDYTEGNGWQYVWLVPHDVKGLVKLFGSDNAFIEKLDSLFIVEGDLGEGAPPDVTGLIGQYAHGNEPSHHIIYLYNYVGRPDKTARLARQIMNEQYGIGAEGLCGNEDVGQMSAWYILSSLGLYQVEPAGGKYILGSPLFDEAEVKVDGGKTFKIVCKNNSKDNIYIQEARLNGKRYTKSYLMYSDIVRGGTFELVMGPQPSNFGKNKKDRP